MRKYRYQAVVLEALCALVIFSGDVYSSTLQERVENFFDDAFYNVRQATNRIGKSFQSKSSWETFPERLEDTVKHHTNCIDRKLGSFFDSLPDLIERRVNNVFTYIERQLDRLTRNLGSFFDRLSDSIERKVNNAFTYIERQFDRLTR